MSEEQHPGVRCPKCGCRHMPALETRRNGRFTIRRRQCRHCGHVSTTREQVVDSVTPSQN